MVYLLGSKFILCPMCVLQWWSPDPFIGLDCKYHLWEIYIQWVTSVLMLKGESQVSDGERRIA